MKDTLYVVRLHERIVCSGNFRQCVLYLVNVADAHESVASLAERYVIEPAPHGCVI